MKRVLAVLILQTLFSQSADAQNAATAEQPTQSRTEIAESNHVLLVAEGGITPAKDSARKEARRAPTEEESLVLTAIEGLMSMPTERALPLIKKVLAGSQSQLVKERAFFVLSQMDHPEANALMLEHAKSPNSPLRKQAIRNIGIGGNAKTIEALQEVYANGDAAVKKEVLQAWMIAGRKSEVYQVALNAKSEPEANEAIRMLAVMGAKDELRKLGETKKSNRGLVDAYSISGDLDSLRKIANGSGETATRLDAIRGIGIIGKDNAKVALREIYIANSDPQLKNAALQALLIASDEQGVLKLYREAKSTEEKRNLLRMLSIMGGDAAMQAIDSTLEGKK
jgi:HEAT repeat protein